MREAYPELLETIGRVTGVIRHEEERFAHTIDIGLRKLEEELAPLLREKKSQGPVSYPGEKAFRLYDTFGLPLDFITDVLRDQGIGIRSRRNSTAPWRSSASAPELPGRARTRKSPARPTPSWRRPSAPSRTFTTARSARDCRIEAIITPEGLANELPAGAEGEIVLDRTPFYAESGGQIADTGTLWNNERTLEVAEVRGAYYPVTGLIAHRVRAKETLRVGDRVAGEADAARRERNKRNHTATHLMHAALRNILGTHVKQAGSLVAPDRLRFDFSHFAPVDPAELTDIEQQVNEQIRQNAEIETDVTTLDDALASGALAFFGDRYPEQNVRVVTIPDPGSPRGFYSKELCGGTHVRRVRRYRRLQDRRGAVGRRGSAPHRGAHRRRRAGRLPARAAVAGGRGGAAARGRRRGQRGARAAGAGPEAGRKAAGSRRGAKPRSPSSIRCSSRCAR